MKFKFRLNKDNLKSNLLGEYLHVINLGPDIYNSTCCYLWHKNSINSARECIGWIPHSEGFPRDKLGSMVKVVSDNEVELSNKKKSMLDKLIEVNKNAATQAAVMETGRLANSTVAKIVAKRFPNLPETPFNALIIANLADVIGKNVRPSPTLKKVTEAMVTQAYVEVYQLIDLEGMISELLAEVGNEAE